MLCLFVSSLEKGLQNISLKYPQNNYQYFIKQFMNPLRKLDQPLKSKHTGKYHFLQIWLCDSKDKSKKA